MLETIACCICKMPDVGTVSGDGERYDTRTCCLPPQSMLRASQEQLH